MKGRNMAWVILGAVLFCLLVFLLYRAFSKPVLWYEFYRAKEKQPYDLLVTSTLLEDYFPGKKFTVGKKSLTSSLHINTDSFACYMFIGYGLFLSEDDRTRLFDFVSEGNEAFISANQFPYGFFQALLHDDYYDYNKNYLQYYSDSMANFNFVQWRVREDSAYNFEYITDWEARQYEWMVFHDSLLRSTSANVITLGSLNETYSNFIKIPYGRGVFFLHTNPIVFTNYELKKERHLEYTEKVFAHLQPANIYWDEFSKVPQYTPHGGDVGDNQTPLRYILSQPSLKWSWYVLLGIAVLFMIFRTKRTRRIIPVIEQNANSSLEYIQTISRLYFMQKSHRVLAMQQMKLFLAFIRNRYHLQTKEIDSDFIKLLSVKSQIPESKIKHINSEFKTINNMDHIEPEHLIEFHHVLDQFYKNCK